MAKVTITLEDSGDEGLILDAKIEGEVEGQESLAISYATSFLHAVKEQSDEVIEIDDDNLN